MSHGMSRMGTGLVVLLTAGCGMAPDYEVPKVDMPADFKVKGPWKVAAPADGAEKGEWWRMFADAELNRLQTVLAAENPTLEAALKRVEMARAMVDEQRAAYFPEIGIGTTGLQNRTSSNSPGFRAGQTLTFWRAPITFDYEVDLWGRVRGGVAASRADLASEEALAANTRLILQAELATQYLQLRALDAESALLEEAVELRRRTLGMVETRFNAGDVAELDVAQAKTELAEAEAEAIAIQRRRAERENAVAALCGRVASSMKLGRRPLTGTPPGVRKALPSSLLERRPDVASRERLMAAANERAGMTRTAYFPQVGISVGGGFESAELDSLFNASSFLSSLGGGVQQTVFDGGLRGARHRRAMAAREEAGANYKETVVTAFREVEDALAAIQVLGKQAVVQAQTVASARRMVELSEKQYEAGFVSYFEVVNAQRALLRAQQGAAQVQGARFEAAVLLVRALGGAW
jgi:multidrug efflux system outer membrane protein